MARNKTPRMTGLLLGTMVLVCGGRAQAGEAVLLLERTAVPVIELPQGLQTIVIERPSFDWRTADIGIYKNQEEAWYNLFLVRLRERFQAYAPGVAILDRRDVGARKDESSLVQGQLDAKPGEGQTRETFAQATIRPRFIVQERAISEQVERSWHKRALEKGARSIPVVGGLAEYKGKYKDVKLWELSVQCDAELIMTATGRVVLSYADIKVHRDKSREGWFSYGARNMTDMESSQSVVNRLISQHVDDLLSICLPVPQRVEMRVEDASADVRRAASILNTGNVRAAAQVATTAWSRSKSEDHAAAFLVGLCAEFDTGLAPEKSIELSRVWYGKALAEDDDNALYAAALNRASRRQTALNSREPLVLNTAVAPENSADTVEEVSSASASAAK